MARRGTRPQGLALYDFSDDEFLAIIRDNCVTPDGWVSTADLVTSIGLESPNPSSNVGVRLGWMRRFGVVERDVEVGSATRGQWRLTARGEAIVEARFTPNQEGLVGELKSEQMWKLARVVSDRYVNADDALANLVRRQFVLGTYRRRFR